MWRGGDDDDDDDDACYFYLQTLLVDSETSVILPWSSRGGSSSLPHLAMVLFVLAERMFCESGFSFSLSLFILSIVSSSRPKVCARERVLGCNGNGLRIGVPCLLE